MNNFSFKVIQAKQEEMMVVCKVTSMKLVDEQNGANFLKGRKKRNLNLVRSNVQNATKILVIHQTVRNFHVKIFKTQIKILKENCYAS